MQRSLMPLDVDGNAYPTARPVFGYSAVCGVCRWVGPARIANGERGPAGEIPLDLPDDAHEAAADDFDRHECGSIIVVTMSTGAHEILAAVLGQLAPMLDAAAVSLGALDPTAVDRLHEAITAVTDRHEATHVEVILGGGADL